MIGNHPPIRQIYVLMKLDRDHFRVHLDNYTLQPGRNPHYHGRNKPPQYRQLDSRDLLWEEMKMEYGTIGPPKAYINLYQRALQ